MLISARMSKTLQFEVMLMIWAKNKPHCNVFFFLLVCVSLQFTSSSVFEGKNYSEFD